MMPQGLVLAKWLLARQSKGAEIEGVWTGNFRPQASFAPKNQIVLLNQAYGKIWSTTFLAANTRGNTEN